MKVLSAILVVFIVFWALIFGGSMKKVPENRFVEVKNDKNT